MSTSTQRIGFWTKVSLRARCSAASLYQQVTDSATLPRIFHGFGALPGVAQCDLIGTGGVRRGHVRRVVTEAGWVIEEEITEATPEDAFETRMVSMRLGPIGWLLGTYRSRWTVEQQGGGSRAVWSMRVESRHALGTPLMMVATYVMLYPAMRRAARRLAAMADQAAPATVSVAPPRAETVPITMPPAVATGRVAQKATA